MLRADAGRLREVGSRCGDRRRLATLDRALGLRALVDGRLGEAIAHLSSAADVGFLGRGLRDAILPARVDLIEALVRSGDLASAAERYSQLHGLLLDMGDPLATAFDERAAALVTGGAEAEQHYRQALAAHVRAGEPFEEARTLLLLGEHLRRERRRRRRARTCTRQFIRSTSWGRRRGRRGPARSSARPAARWVELDASRPATCPRSPHRCARLPTPWPRG